MTNERVRSLVCPAAVRGVSFLVLLSLTLGPASGQAPPSDVIVGPNLRVAPGEFNEPWMAASPTNPDFLIAVTQNNGLSFADPAATALTPRNNSAFTSRDGGVTWEPVALPGYEPWSFDPMVVAGPEGRLWILYTVIGGNTFGGQLPVAPERPQGTIMVWSTADEGATWDGPFELRAPVPPDHPRIAADWSDGPNRGRLYVVWNDVADSFLKNEFQVFLHTLDDGGETVSEPKLLAQIQGGKLVATEPVILSDGTLLVTFYQYFFPLIDEKNRDMPFFTMTSTDGGATFSDPEVAFRIGHHSWPYAQTEMASAFTLPIVAWDRTGGPYRDNIYVVWDQVGDDTSDIWFRRSTDRGGSWSEPLKLNDNDGPAEDAPLDDRMIPVIEVNRDGVIGVAWYDRRRDQARRCWELYFTSSRDGGATFSPNVPVDSQPSCPPQAKGPALRVHNVAPDPTVEEVPEEELAKMSLIERMTVATAQQGRRARGRYFGDLEHPRVEVTFDNARGAQPGHYLGLAANTEGVFHPLWISRRNGMDELFTTTVEVGGGVPRPSPGPETDVTEHMLVVTGPPAYDPAAGTVTFDVQLRNVSEGAIRGPVQLRSTGSPGREWSFEGKLGSHDRLDPGGMTEPVKVELQVTSGTDAHLDLRIYGRRER